MLKWILRAIHIAAAINVRRSTILFVLELLRQFDLSLVKSTGQSNAKRSRKAGFVYVIRDEANGKRFKTGYRAEPPWRNRQLRAETSKNAHFILIVPAKDSSALEKRLRRAYAKGTKKKEWFELEKNELREIMIIAALVMAVAGDTLGMAPVDKEVVQLGKKLLAYLNELASKMWGNWQSKQTQPDEEGEPSIAEPDFNDFSAIPDFDWNWESVLLKDYRSLPKLKGKEAYLSVIRDNNAKQGRIFFDDQPAKSIETALVDRALRFPLEIVLILKVDNKKKAKQSLLSASRDRDGNSWVALSDEALGEIKKFATADWQGGSLYVSPKKHWGLTSLMSDNYNNYPELDKPAGYVCLVQGVNPGKLRKIWETLHPKTLAGDIRLALMLNNPHDVHTSSEPIQFRCIIKAAHAESFQKFLHKRYAKAETGNWFELTNEQLQEIHNMGV